MLPAQCSPEVRSPKTLSIVTASISGILALPAIVCNLLIIIAVIRDPVKKLRTPFNYFLINLAFSDFLVGVLCLSLSTWVHARESNGPLPPTFVMFIHLTLFITSTASTLSMVVLSIDRLVMITHAMKYRIYLKWKLCMKISLLIWIIAICLPLLYFFMGYVSYLMLHVHVLVLTTAIILMVNYAFVYKFLHRRTQSSQRPSVPSFTQTKNLIIEKQVTRTLLCIVVFFLLTMLPAMVVIYILHFCKNCPCNVRHVLRDVCFLLFPASSAINPLICLFRLKNISVAIKMSVFGHT